MSDHGVSATSQDNTQEHYAIQSIPPPKLARQRRVNLLVRQLQKVRLQSEMLSTESGESVDRSWFGPVFWKLILTRNVSGETVSREEPLSKGGVGIRITWFKIPERYVDAIWYLSGGNHAYMLGVLGRGTGGLWRSGADGTYLLKRTHRLQAIRQHNRRIPSAWEILFWG